MLHHQCKELDQGEYGFITEAELVTREEYDQALELNKKALKLAEETGNMISMSRIMGNIGTLYHKTGEPDKGLEYHVRHMKWAEHVGDKSGYGVACNRIGAILNEKIDAQFT